MNHKSSMNKVNRQFSKKTRYLIAIGGVLVIVFAYFVFTALGGTIIGKTLRTDKNLEKGLLLYWTFDAKDIDLTQPTAEVRDSSGNGRNGDLIFPPN